MADQATQLKSIADKLEGSYQALRRAASSIAGLLQLGKATCEEVRAYNLWALAIYNTQRGMLAALKAGGEKGVPDLPTYPTVFAWKGMSGESALNVSCAGGGATLSGLMDRALRGPSEANPYIGTDQVQIVTTDQYLYAPEKSPSFATLLSIQAARASNNNGMGFVGVIIAICAVAIAVTVAVAAIMHYLEVSKVQESNTEQVRQQAEAFAIYTKARLDCYGTCTQQGKSTDECVSICQKLVKEPNILLPGQTGKWGWLQWTGFTVVAGLGTLAAIKLWQRHQAGKPLLDIPDFSLDGSELGAADESWDEDEEEAKPTKRKRGSSSTSTEVRSPTSTATEVRSPTSTSTEVRSPTSTSTDAYTSGNVTVTGGAGAGATTSVKIIAAKAKERRVDSKAHGYRSRGSQNRMKDMIKATSASRAPSPMPAIMKATGARKSARRSATK